MLVRNDWNADVTGDYALEGFPCVCALLSSVLLFFTIRSLRDASHAGVSVFSRRQSLTFSRGKWLAPDGWKLKVDHHPHLVFCIHQRLKIQCIPCGGQRVCPHGRQKTECDWGSLGMGVSCCIMRNPWAWWMMDDLRGRSLSTAFPTRVTRYNLWYREGINMCKDKHYIHIESHR